MPQKCRNCIRCRRISAETVYVSVTAYGNGTVCIPAVISPCIISADIAEYAESAAAAGMRDVNIANGRSLIKSPRIIPFF